MRLAASHVSQRVARGNTRLTPLVEQRRSHLADVVCRDRTPLFRSQAAFARQAGLGPRTIAKIELGEPGGYGERTKRGVEAALQWVEGSFEDVLAGGEPTYLDDAQFEELRIIWRRLPASARAMLLRVAREQDD